MMAKLAFEDVKIEFEPIVKLVCLEFRCIHNLANWAGDPRAACNLKRLVIGKDGKCRMMNLKTKEDKQADVSEG